MKYMEEVKSGSWWEQGRSEGRLMAVSGRVADGVLRKIRKAGITQSRAIFKLEL